MRAYKLWILDLKAAFHKQKFFLAAFGIFSLLWMVAYSEMSSREALEIGDFFLHSFRGIEPVSEREESTVVRLPISWLALLLGAHLSVIGYAEESTPYGQQLFWRCKRAYWWISKCFWNMTVTLLYFGVGATVYTILTVIKGGSLKLNGAEEFLTLAVIMCISWNLFQMTISMYLGTFAGLFATVIMLLASVYIFSPFLPGNYMMYIRTEWDWEYGVKSVYGYFMACLLAILSVTGGLYQVRNRDYLIKEQR